MGTERARKDEIFNAAAEIADVDERASYIAEACGNNSTLRAEIEELLRHDDAEDSLLDRSAPGLGATIDQPITERPGTQIGPYKLLQQVGEGGMGVVYMAEQKEPVKRRVALKIIKPGMDTRQVIARFEAERQALAMMDHPNIAKVLDAGQTDSGRPYFVMELVKGVPVTQYCDEQHLTPKERLELFVPICQAVQHAHQKGIIHRDLKPSNVLVALYDGQPVCKVIDFGVAKATSQTLTEKTMFTQLGQVVGTLEYMSPEQAQVNQLDVDTRSDIYSLGVLLYELLTGDTPFDRQRLRSAAFDEMLRIIREEEPSKPSTKVSSSQLLPSIAANRRIEPAKLGSTIRGELDWIVMKALEKDRARRYETASKFAEDVQHYLNDEPVVACPPSAGYRFRKFVRRNKTTIAAAAALLLVTFTIMGAIGWSLRDRAARRARVTAEIESALDQIDRLSEKRDWAQALDEARRAESILSSGGAEPGAEHRLAQVLADLRLVERLEQPRLIESRFTATSRLSTGGSGINASKQIWWDLSGAEKAYHQAFADVEVTLQDLPSAAKKLRSRTRIRDEVSVSLLDWSRMLRMMGQGNEHDSNWHVPLALADQIDPDPWRRQLRAAFRHDTDAQSLSMLAASADPQRLEPLNVVILARLLLDQHAAEDAIDVLQAAQSRHPGDFWINWMLASCLQNSKPPQLSEALTFYRVAHALRPESAAVNAIGQVLGDQDRFDEAIALYNRAIADSPTSALLHNNLGMLLFRQGKLDQAIACCKRALGLDPTWANTPRTLGWILFEAGKPDEAIPWYESALELDPKDATLHSDLGSCWARLGELEKALACLHKALEHNPRSESALLNLGLFCTERGKLDEALSFLLRAVEANPRFGRVHVALGIVYVEQRKWNEAVACFQRAIELDPQNAEAHGNLGHVLAEQEKNDEALECFQKAIQINPHFAAVYVKLGACLVEQGKQEEGIECFRKAIALDPGLALAHYNLGISLSQSQETSDQAIVHASKALDIRRDELGEEHPDTLLTMHFLAHTLNGQRRFTEAEPLYRDMIDIRLRVLGAEHLDTLASMEGLARTLRAQGRLTQAEKLYRDVLEIRRRVQGADHPETLACMLDLGYVLRAQKRPGDADETFRDAVEMMPRLLSAEHPLALQAAPHLANWFSNRSWHFSTAIDVNQRDPQKAVAFARDATKLQPDIANHWSNLGVALYRNGQFQEAVDTLQKADRLWDGGDLVHRMFLAMALSKLGREEDARRKYAQGAAWIAAHKPNDKAQQRFLQEAEALLGLGADGRALLIEEYYTRGFPETPTAQDLVDRGTWYRNKGSFEEAVRDFAEASGIDPKFSDEYRMLALELIETRGESGPSLFDHLWLAIIEYRLGDQQRAADQLNLAVKALNSSPDHWRKEPGFQLLRHTLETSLRTRQKNTSE